MVADQIFDSGLAFAQNFKHPISLRHPEATKNNEEHDTAVIFKNLEVPELPRVLLKTLKNMNLSSFSRSTGSIIASKSLHKKPSRCAKMAPR